MTVQLTLDDQGSATVTLLDGAERRHLAAAMGGCPLPDMLDDLALRVRLALGDPVDPPPQPVAYLYSAATEAVAGCEAAIALVHTGDFAAAARRLGVVRRYDGGAAFVLETMASIASVQGDAEAAGRLAREALGLTQRLAPTTTHRLLRTLLLARASTEPQLAGRFDQELWTLAQVAARERPYDPEVRFTAGMALNFLGRFGEAQPALAALAERLPDHAGVQYHLGWAALGNGDPTAARAAFDRAAVALPTRATVVPRALARYGQGDHDGLRTFLAGLAGEPRVRSGSALHEVRRMQAAHELLCGRVEDAASLMFEDLSWLLAHPAVLELRSGELADTAETLVRLGQGERLRPHLASIAELWPKSPVADAVTFAQGLVDAAATRTRSRTAEDGLLRRGCTFWSHALGAFGHHQQGELADEQRALGLAAQESSSPLLKAALIGNLRAQGRNAEADNLRAVLHRELVAVDLRRRSQHPLLGPELALAWLSQ